MNLPEMIRSEKYLLWESETISDFGFSNPELSLRINEAAEDGINGRTHAEIIDARVPNPFFARFFFTIIA